MLGIQSNIHENADYDEKEDSEHFQERKPELYNEISLFNRRSKRGGIAYRARRMPSRVQHSQ